MGFKRRTKAEVALRVLQTGVGQRLVEDTRAKLRSELSAVEVERARILAQLGELEALRATRSGSGRAAHPRRRFSREQLLDRLEAHARDLQQRHGITDRQRQIVELAIKGLPTAEIAEQLSMSTNTLKYHARSIVNACGVQRLRDLVREFWGEGPG